MNAKTVLPPPPGCLWLPQAADRLGVKPRTLHTWRQRRKGPASFRHAGRVVYRETALAEYLAECEAADSHSNPALDPTARKPELDIAIPDRPKRRRTPAPATEEEAIRGAGLVLAEIRANRDALSPRAAAEAAWYRGHPLTVDEIEELIISQRMRALARLRAQAPRSAPLANDEPEGQQ